MGFGTVAFDTLSVSGAITGTAKSVDSDYLLNGSAKAHYTTASGASPIISLNISSVTDSGTGLYFGTLTNVLSGTNHGGGGGGYTSSSQDRSVNVGMTDTANQLHAHARIGGSLTDFLIHATTMGDLA